MGGERGGVAVTVAVLIVPLLVLCGLAIDIGMLQIARRDAQIAADQGALAAAWAACHDQDPQTKGHELAVTNYPEASYVTVEPADDGYRTEVGATVETAFASVIGMDTLDTEAEAVAECKPIYDGIPAMFAGDGSCNPALDWSGNGGTAVGDVHTNGDLDVTGHDNTVTGDATVVGDDKVTPGNQNTIDTSPATEEPFPDLGVTIEDYAPNGVKWQEATAMGVNRNPSGTGDITLNNSNRVRRGLYYTTGNIRINENNPGPLDVTFVVNPPPGQVRSIEFIGSGQTFTPWDAERHILVFNTSLDCTDTVIRLRGSNGNWNGIFFAPNGQIEISGSNNGSRVAGALIGATVDLQGSNFTVDATELQGEPTKTVRLTK